MVDLIKNFPLNYFDHHVKFGYCVSPYAGVCTDVPNILGTLGLTPWESGVHGPYKHTPPHVLPRRIWWFWVDRYKRRPTHVGIDPPKNGLLATRFSKSLKVIETDTGRAATYDFLLVIHSTHEPISYRFHEINGDFGRKSHIFLSPCVFSAPVKFCNYDAPARGSKLLTIMCIRLHTIPQSDGRRDGKRRIKIALSACETEWEYRRVHPTMHMIVTRVSKYLRRNRHKF